jgi:hypothetical protein
MDSFVCRRPSIPRTDLSQKANTTNSCARGFQRNVSPGFLGTHRYSRWPPPSHFGCVAGGRQGFSLVASGDGWERTPRRKAFIPLSPPQLGCQNRCGCFFFEALNFCNVEIFFFFFFKKNLFGRRVMCWDPGWDRGREGSVCLLLLGLEPAVQRGPGTWSWI